LMQLTIHAF